MHPSPPPEGALLLEDGTLFRGVAHSPGTAFGEVVFNTSMTGYQEILTDPSYRRQIVVMTLPHIGNYGTSDAAAESARPWAEGFVARRFTERASGWHSEEELPDYLRRHRVPALAGVDTRALVRRLRERGAMRGVLTSEVGDLDRLAAELAEYPSMAGRALAYEVTGDRERVVEPSAPGGGDGLHLALYDYGAKASIARCLAERGARVTVLPARTPASRCRELGVDGVVLSNGPGDPEPLADLVAEVRELLRADLPIFGICLGHQLLARALGARTYKLKFGHHGGNQPVRETATGRVTITSQNHGFAVDPESLPRHCRVSHENLNDGTVEGLELAERPVFSVQYHPEAAPGPHDSRGLFDRFLERLRERRAAAAPGAG
jgi:carbamoyl-phosphate synthase small subunit